MAGKGDKPRSCFSKSFRDNYDQINWGKRKDKRNRKRNSRYILRNKSRDRKQQRNYRRDDSKGPAQ